MAGIKISALPAVGSPGLTDVFPLVQAGVTYKCTLTQLFNLYNTNFFPVTLANGGTGTALTASNGGIVYSNATTMAILAGTATANQILMSGASSAPHWSTVTYPSASGWTAFTPTLTLVGGAGNTVPTFTGVAANYQQIGNTVFIEVSLSNSAGGTAGAGTGVLHMALPVTSGSGENSGGDLSGVIQNGAAYSPLIAIIPASSATMIFNNMPTISTVNITNGNNFNDANIRAIQFKTFYQV